MKKYIKPQINVVIVEAEAMLAASDPSGIKTTLLPQDNVITSSDDILSKKYSAWGDDEEEE